jgi:hypothetical protein
MTGETGESRRAVSGLSGAEPAVNRPDPGDLAGQQAALVAALVAGAPVPPGFDEDRLAAARTALVNKRAGEVAHAWPALARELGPRWRPRFAEWAAGRPPAGPLRDGFDLARELARSGGLPPGAVAELVAREGYWRYDGQGPPRRRRLPVRLRRWLGAWRVRRLG